jgi:sulfur relay (sulfurtransferase) DsrC/TusE family protein
LFHTFYDSREYQIYVNKKHLPKLKNIFLDIKSFKMNNGSNVGFEGVMTESEAKGILKAFNQELSFTKKEIDDKFRSFYTSFKFSPTIKEIIEYCRTTDSRSGFFRCIHLNNISSKTFNFNGKRKTINSVAKEQKIPVSTFIIQYMKYNDIEFNFEY